MYCEFYQLTERPFNVTPDPKFLYLNARYREALASLNYGISQRKGFITLIGEAGTGKTTLLKKLLDDLDQKTKTVFIFNTNVSFEEILEYILAEFDLPVHNGKKLYMLQRLNTFLLEELRGAGNVALLIDEAQDLEFSVLEDLRLLSNLETAKEKILQIVLSGQPELGQKLSNPVLRQLRQRIGINCRLLPLSRDEITEYVQYRLQAAQCPDLKLFTREAEDQIYHFSRGIPRLVNVVCDNALVIGYALGKKRISDDVIREAAADLLSLEARSEEVKELPPVAAAPSITTTAKPARPNARLGVIGVFVLSLVIGLFSIGRTLLTRSPNVTITSSPPSSFEVIRPGSHPRGAGIDPPREPGDANPEAPDAGVDRRDDEGLERPVPDPRSNVAAAPAPAPAVPPTASRPERDAYHNELAALPHRQGDPSRSEPASDVERNVATDPRLRPGMRASGSEIPATPTVRVMRPESLAKAPAPTVRVVPPTVSLVVEEGAHSQKLPAPTPPKGTDSRSKPAEVVAKPKPTPAEAKVAAVPANVDAVEDDIEAPSRPARTNDSLDAEGEGEEVPSRRERVAAVQDPPNREATIAARESAERSAKAEESSGEAAADEAGKGLDGVAYANQVVRVGDSVSGIAMRKYGQASYTVLDLLKIANPDVADIDTISVGQTIRLPELGDGYPVLRESGKYSLLVVSSPHVDKAKQLQAALKTRGYDAKVTNTSVGDGKPLYRVVVGGFASREKVSTAGKQVQKLFRENPSLADLAQ